MFTQKSESRAPNTKKIAFDFWGWPSEISHENCQRLINLGKDSWNEAFTYGSEHSIIKKDDFRKSDVVWVKDQWVYDLIWDYMASANEQAGWKYNIVAAEDCQLTRYTKGEYYSWHRDGLGSHIEVIDTPDNKSLYGNVRKLSMSILLNDDYGGGNFQMHGLEKDDTLIRGRGSVIVFPSFIDHQVTPVTKGTKYSLVTWFVGPPFV